MTSYFGILYHLNAGEYVEQYDYPKDLDAIAAITNGSSFTHTRMVRHRIGAQSYKVHLEGYDQTDILTQQGPTKRREFFYLTEDRFHGLRMGDYKFLFTEQERWFQDPRISLTSPSIVNLKLDPFERLHTTRGYDEWAENRSWLFGQLGESWASS